MNSSISLVNKSKTIKAKKTANSFWTNVKNRTLVIKISSIVLVLALIGLGSWRIAKTTEGKILPKVTVAGIAVGGKTPAQAKTLVQDYVNKLDTEGPQITYEDQTINPKLNEMGMSFDIDKVIWEAYNYGRQGNWQNRVKENANMITKNYNVTLMPVVDEQKFDAFLGSIAQVVEVAPQNAGLVITNGNISVTASKVGRGLDKEKLNQDLTTLINQNKLNSKIVLATSTLRPNINEQGTVQAQEQAAKFMNAAPINISYENDTYTANKAEVGSWIGFSENNDVIVADISAAKISAFAGFVASKVEIAKIDKEVMEGTGEVLVEGQDGRGVDANRLASDIRARVLSQNTGPVIGVGTYLITKSTVTKNPHAQAGRYTGHYIDINLSEQTLYAFNSSELVNQFLISSGKSGYGTPEGQFAVWGKTRAQTMDGPGYSLPNVEWISWFNGEISIHGTYWHNNFGTPMSHGCINASNLNAEWVYNFVEEGTPVYVHY